MNKPLTMVIKETRMKIANTCNESGLSPIILDLIMQGLYSEIHNLAERQSSEEEAAYRATLGSNAEDVRQNNGESSE